LNFAYRPWARPCRPVLNFREIKYDGYRLFVARDGDRVRLTTKGGNDFTKRYPRIVEAALRNHARESLSA
jgi:ATP-dependent DNA ligase